ncbi:MAG TPA: hypothetical protein PKK15_07570, partial [Kouleothrix sp.]|nr:hypothetical protein [Kouleothrix sp.]
MPSIFELPEFEPYRQGWQARCARYRRNREYYDGRAYERIRATALQLGLPQRLYEGTRTLFSPLRRVVRVDCAKIPAGWALPRDASVATQERVKTLRKLAGADMEYGRFLKRAAVNGEAGLMLSGEPANPIISALRPDEIVLGTLPDTRPFAMILKRRVIGGVPYLGQSYFMPGAIDEWAMVVTADLVTIYHDGGLVGRSPNAFRFIPVLLSVYEEGEDGCGESAFHGVLELLDRVNEIASLTLDTIARNAEPLLVGTGVTEVQRDDSSDALLSQNPDAKFYTIDPNLAIAETLAFIQDVRGEFKTLLPQLTIDRLGSMSDLAYDTVITMMQELGDHIVDVRTNVDVAIETIERWIMGTQGGIPDDYELDRDRRWLALTESQQLDLESKRLAIEAQKRLATAPAAPTPPAPGAPGQETPNATRAGATAQRPG